MCFNQILKSQLVKCEHIKLVFIKRVLVQIEKVKKMEKKEIDPFILGMREKDYPLDFNLSHKC